MIENILPKMAENYLSVINADKPQIPNKENPMSNKTITFNMNARLSLITSKIDYAANHGSLIFPPNHAEVAEGHRKYDIFRFLENDYKMHI